MMGLAQNNNTGRCCPCSTESHTCVQASSRCLLPALVMAGRVKLDLPFSFLANRQTADTPKTNEQPSPVHQSSTQPPQAKRRTGLFGAV